MLTCFQRGWTAKFVSRDSIKSVFCDHEPLREAMKGRPSYGKETLGLGYFGIQHTAGAPLFLVDSQSLDFDMGGFDLDGIDDGYDDFDDRSDDELDWKIRIWNSSMRTIWTVLPLKVALTYQIRVKTIAMLISKSWMGT